MTGVATAVLPAVPAVADAVSAAAESFVDPARYVGHVLIGVEGPVAASQVPQWTISAAAVGVFAVLAAVVPAFLAVLRHRLPARARALGDVVSPAVSLLHRVHSGHIGDYVAWLLLGVAVLAALITVRS